MAYAPITTTTGEAITSVGGGSITSSIELPDWVEVVAGVTEAWVPQAATTTEVWTNA